MDCCNRSFPGPHTRTAVACRAVRATQFGTAILIAVLYGIDLGDWSKTQTSADSRWVYAEVVAGFSILIAPIFGYFGPNFRSVAYISLWCTLDALLCLLWLVSSAVFGQIAVGTSLVELRFLESTVSAAFGLSLFSTLLWLASAITACVVCCARGRTAKKGTGRDNALLRETDLLKETQNGGSGFSYSGSEVDQKGLGDFVAKDLKEAEVSRETDRSFPEDEKPSGSPPYYTEIDAQRGWCDA